VAPPSLFSAFAQSLQDIALQQIPLLLQNQDWQSRYRILMQLGKHLPAFDASLQQQQFRIAGCESQFWLIHTEDSGGRHYWAFDSDARIIKGLACLMISSINGKTAREIAASEPLALLQQLQLGQNLSQSRNNGLLSVVQQAYRQAGLS